MCHQIPSLFAHDDTQAQWTKVHLGFPPAGLYCAWQKRVILLHESSLEVTAALMLREISV
jgi:hypothetical protein